jgi:hypothetical protein
MEQRRSCEANSGSASHDIPYYSYIRPSPVVFSNISQYAEFLWREMTSRLSVDYDRLLIQHILRYSPTG